MRIASFTFVIFLLSVNYSFGDTETPSHIYRLSYSENKLSIIDRQTRDMTELSLESPSSKLFIHQSIGAIYSRENRSFTLIDLSLKQIKSMFCIGLTFNYLVQIGQIIYGVTDDGLVYSLDLVERFLLIKYKVGSGVTYFVAYKNRLIALNPTEGYVSIIDPETDETEYVGEIGDNPAELQVLDNKVFVLNAQSQTIARIDLAGE